MNPARENAKKLTLSRQTVRTLTTDELKRVAGGGNCRGSIR